LSKRGAWGWAPGAGRREEMSLGDRNAIRSPGGAACERRQQNDIDNTLANWQEYKRRKKEG